MRVDSGILKYGAISMAHKHQPPPFSGLKCEYQIYYTTNTVLPSSVRGLPRSREPAAISRRIPGESAAEFEPRSVHVGSVVDKMTLGQVF
jgi:hypothetical protein